MASGSRTSLPSSPVDDTYETDISDQEAEAAGLLTQETKNTEDLQYPDRVSYSRTRVLCIRAVALLCACTLSVGSH